MKKFSLRQVCAASLVAAGAWGVTGTAQAAAVVTPLADTSQGAAAQLVNTLLSSNGSIAVNGSSINYSGAATASGTFTNGGTGASGLGIDSGVVLTTGDARFIGSSAAFPFDNANKSPSFTAGNFDNSLTANTTGGHAALDALAGGAGSTTNASVLSFDFVPVFSTLKLSFVFGAEDYNDFVGFGFADVFGIFVNGVNVALTPNSGLAISVDTLNCALAATDCDFYRDNAPFSDAIDTELDGLSVLLTLSVNVLAGQSNSLLIGIADRGDSFSDSAVLLAAGSLESVGAQAVPEPATPALLALAAALGLGLGRRRRNRR